jgi:hypothetical protein
MILVVFVYMDINLKGKGVYKMWRKIIDFILLCLTTFSNISAISWRPVSEVEEAGIHGEYR